MAEVSVRLDSAALREILSGPNGVVLRELDRRANLVANRARTLCPVWHGRLRASIHTRHAVAANGAPAVEVVAATNYAMWVHEGTGIYGPRHARIYPRTAQFLRFVPKGASAAVYVRSIAGMRGRPFLRDALAAASG